MSTIETLSWTRADEQPVVPTSAANDASLAISASEQEANHSAWERVIDSTLIEWGRNPQLLTDDGVCAPTGAIIERACKLAMALRDEGCPPPRRVIGSADGGIVFERWEGPRLAQIEVCDDGSILFTAFDHGRMTERVLLLD